MDQTSYLSNMSNMKNENKIKQCSETRAASLVWAQLRQASEPNRREANEGLRRAAKGCEGCEAKMENFI